MDLLQLSIYIARGLIYFIIFYIGATVFSFLNVVVYRLPQKMSFTRGRSMCTTCKHELRAKDLFPIFSWCFLKGKCRYCGAKISSRYTFVELFGGIVSVFFYIYYGASLECLTMFLFFCLITVIALIDHDTMEIPPILNILIFVLGIISIWTIGNVSIIDRIIGMLCISLPLFIIVLIVPDGFGGGDIKLMFAAGFFLGWKCTVVAFMIALIAGGIYGIVLMIRRKKGKKDHFAFGPFLTVGMAISVFCGEFLLNQYIEYIKLMFAD